MTSQQKSVKQLSAELVVDAGAELGESPWWDSRIERLVWVDITGRAVHLFDPQREADETYPVARMVGAAVPRAGGGYALAVEGGIAAWKPGGDLELLAEPERGEPRRFNDAACDPRGRLLAGTVPLDDTPAAGRLYRVGSDHDATVLLEGLGLPNGLDWSPGGETLYFTDSVKGTVDAYPYDLDSGSIGPPRPAVEPEAGIPDGHTVDAEGNLWVALWSAGEVGCFTPEGRRIATISLPVAAVTSCGFGGDDLASLFITTMVHPPPDPGPADDKAGALFACDVGVPGQPVSAYAG